MVTPLALTATDSLWPCTLAVPTPIVADLAAAIAATANSATTATRVALLHRVLLRAPPGLGVDTPSRPPLPRNPSRSAAGHRRQDDQRVAVADRRVQAVQHPHVLIVEVHVDVPVQAAVGGEQLGLGLRVIVGDGAQDLPDRGALRAQLLLPADGRAEHGWDANGGHA